MERYSGIARAKGHKIDVVKTDPWRKSTAKEYDLKGSLFRKRYYTKVTPAPKAGIKGISRRKKEPEWTADLVLFVHAITKEMVREDPARWKQIAGKWFVDLEVTMFPTWMGESFGEFMAYHKERPFDTKEKAMAAARDFKAEADRLRLQDLLDAALSGKEVRRA